MQKRPWIPWTGLLVMLIAVSDGLGWWQSPTPSITLPSQVSEVAISDDGTLSALLTNEGQVWLWPAPLGRVAEPMLFAAGSFTTIALNANHTFLAAGDRAGTVTLWDLSETNQPEVFQEVLSIDHSISRLAFSPDGALLAIGGRAGRLSLLDLSTKRLHPHFPNPNGNTIDLLVFSPHSQFLASSGTGQIAVSVWSVANLAQLTTIDNTYPSEALIFSLDRSTNRVFSPKALAFSLDSTTLSILHGTDLIGEWALDSGQPLWRRTTLNSPTLGMFADYGKIVIYNGSPNRNFFAGLPIISGSDDPSVYLASLEGPHFPVGDWRNDIPLDEELLYRQSSYVLALAITPDGRVIVSGDRNGRVLRYEVL